MRLLKLETPQRHVQRSRPGGWVAHTTSRNLGMDPVTFCGA